VIQHREVTYAAALEQAHDLLEVGLRADARDVVLHDVLDQHRSLLFAGHHRSMTRRPLDTVSATAVPRSITATSRACGRCVSQRPAPAPHTEALLPHPLCRTTWSHVEFGR
jgi:hypothetical protein